MKTKGRVNRRSGIGFRDSAPIDDCEYRRIAVQGGESETEGVETTIKLALAERAVTVARLSTGRIYQRESDGLKAARDPHLSPACPGHRQRKKERERDRRPAPLRASS